MKHSGMRTWCGSILLQLIMALFAASASGADSTERGAAISLGELHGIQSEEMSAVASYQVHTPPGYAETDQSYPLAIVLGGDQHFAHLSTSIDFLAAAERIPQLILVGVNTMHEWGDLNPPLSSPSAKTSMNRQNNAGDKFLRFISDELIPEIDRKYRTKRYRILLGHSQAGMFVIYSLLQRPEVFNGYVAISPAVQWDNDALIVAAAPFLANHKDLRADVFLALGNENRRMLASTWKFAGLLAENTPAEIPGLRWRLNRYEEEAHETISLRGMQEGLKAVFDSWYVADALTLFEQSGLAGLQKHYAEVSKRMGYAVAVPRGSYDDIVEGLRQKKRFDEAKMVLEQAIIAYPNEARFYFILGQVYFEMRDSSRGVDSFKQSLQLSPTEYRGAIASYNMDPGKLLPEIKPSAQALRTYTGKYRAANASRTIRRKGNALVMSAGSVDCEMKFLSEIRFYCGSMDGTFDKGGNERVRSLTLHSRDSRYVMTKE